MNRILLLGSRTFAPLDQVRDDIGALPSGVMVIGVGKSPLIDAAQSVARTFKTMPLATDRTPLVDAARVKDTAVWCYAALDPETREITEGTGQIIDWLTSNGIDVDVRRSILTAPQAAAFHRLESELEKLGDAPANRRRYRLNRVLTAAVALYRVHEAIYRWLEENNTDASLLRKARQNYERDLVDEDLVAQIDDGADTWIRNLKRYELITRLLVRAKQSVDLAPLTGADEQRDAA